MTLVTGDLTDIAEDLMGRVAQLEQRITSPYFAIPNGSNPTFPTLNIGDWNGPQQSVPISQTIGVPSGLTGVPTTTFDDVAIDASWTPPLDGSAVQYQIDIAVKDVNTGIYTLIDSRTTSGASAHISGLTPGATYGIKVSGINRIGIVSAPTAWTDVATSPDASIPAAPTGVVATAGTTSIMLTWNDNGEADVAGGAGRYEVQYDTSGAFTAPTTVSVSGTITSFAGLTSGTAYFFRVRARDSSNNPGPWSTTASATPGTAGGGAVPSDGQAPASSPTPTITAGIGFLYAKWGPVSNVDQVSYDVHISTTNGFAPSSATLVTNTTATSTFLRTMPDNTPFIYGATYYVKIVARDMDGSSTNVGGQAQGTIPNVLSGDIGFKVGGGNLLPNSSFEGTDMSAWTSGTVPAPTIARSQAVPAFHGGWVAAVTAQAAGTFNFYALAAIVPNQPYTASYYVRMSAAGRTAELFLNFYDSAFGFLGQVPLVSVPATNTGWTRISATGTSPANAAFAVPILRCNAAAAAGEVMYVDGAQVENGDIATAYAPKPDEILPGTVTGNMVAPNTITATNILGKTITANEIASGTITASSGIIASLDAGVITSGYIDVARLRAGSISAAQLSVTTGGDNLQTRSRPTAQSSGLSPQGTGSTVTVSDGTTTYFVPGQPCWIVTTAAPTSAYFGAVHADHIPCLPNTVYTASCWVRSPSSTAQIQPRITTETSALGYVNEPSTQVNLTSTWQRVTWTFTTGSNVERLNFSFQFPYSNIPAAGITYHVYGLQIERADLASAYKPNVSENMPGSIDASSIIAGTITSDRINATIGLDATLIKFNTMSGDRISAKTLDINAIKTSTLSATTITLASDGSIVGGSNPLGVGSAQTGFVLNGGAMTTYKGGATTFRLNFATGDAFFSGDITGSTGTFSGTVQAAVFRTAAVGSPRIEITPATNSRQIKFIDQNGNQATIEQWLSGVNTPGIRIYVPTWANGGTAGVNPEFRMYQGTGTTPGFISLGNQRQSDWVVLGGLQITEQGLVDMYGIMAPSTGRQSAVEIDLNPTIHLSAKGITLDSIDTSTFTVTINPWDSYAYRAELWFSNFAVLSTVTAVNNYLSGAQIGDFVIKSRNANGRVGIGGNDGGGMFVDFNGGLTVVGTNALDCALSFRGTSGHILGSTNWENTVWGQFQAATGGYLTASTIHSKADIEPIEQGWALDVIRKAPAYKFHNIHGDFAEHASHPDYPGMPMASDSEDWHLGPMYEDLHDHVRDTTSPTVNLGDLIGVLWAGVAELSDRVEALEGAH